VWGTDFTRGWGQSTSEIDRKEAGEDPYEQGDPPPSRAHCKRVRQGLTLILEGKIERIFEERDEKRDLAKENTAEKAFFVGGGFS
jgi:hypothetical protein